MNSVVEVGKTGTVASDSTDFVQSHVDSFFYNKDGAVPYEKVDITDVMTELHLPKDVLSKLPIEMPKQSPLGEIASGYIASPAEALTEIGGVAYNVLMAGAEFVGELTKSMIEVGVKVWGAIKDAAGKIKDAVVSGFNIIVDFLIGVFKQGLDRLIKGITSLFHGMAKEYADVLDKLILTDEESSSDKGVKKPLLLDGIEINWDALWILINLYLEKTLVTMSMFSIFMGLEATYMAMSFGLGAAANTLLLSTLKSVALGLILGKALTSVAGSIYGATQGGMSERVRSILNIFGFGVGFGGLIRSIIDNLIKAKDRAGKGMLYYFGIVAAFGGFLHSTAVRMKDFSGKVLKWVDVIGIVISITGLILMLSSILKNKYQKTKQSTFTITSTVEFIIAIAGIIAAGTTVYDHWSGGEWS